MQQQRRQEWFHQHLRLNGFDPMEIDGTDPATAFRGPCTPWKNGSPPVPQFPPGHPVPVPLHYTVAEAPKGFGFPVQGRCRHTTCRWRKPSRRCARAPAVQRGRAPCSSPLANSTRALAVLCRHRDQQRSLERDHPLARRRVDAPAMPVAQWHAVGTGTVSPMAALDAAFAAIVQANPQLRPRVKQPDELRSNRMGRRWTC